MNWRKWLWVDLLVAFVAFTGWVIWDVGGVGPMFEVVLGTMAGWQVALDLVLGLAAGLWLMVPDARRRGLNPWPYVVATCLTGSPGLLAYLVVREWRGAPAATPALAPAV